MMSSLDLSPKCLWTAIVRTGTGGTRCLALRGRTDRLNSSSSACYKLNIISRTSSHFCLEQRPFWLISYGTRLRH
jgi:hypothetical protein